MIIFRYLGKEVYQTCLAITSILLFIVICNQLIVYITRAASGSLPAAIVLKIVLVQVPVFLTILLPLGFFLGILLSYGRLYVENEMTVLSACGMSYGWLKRSTLIYSILVMITVAYLAFFADPQVTAYEYELQATAGITTLVETTMPGSFRLLPDNQHVLYVGTISHDRKRMDNIFVASKMNHPDPNVVVPEQWDIMSAQYGSFFTDLKNGGEFVVAHNGYYYNGAPGENGYKIVKFDGLGIKLTNRLEMPISRADALPTSAIVAGYHKNVAFAGELQYRISMPLTVPLLALLAVPLSRVRPRQGKFAQLIPAILLYIIYANMILVAESWIKKGHLSVTLGLWWIHVVILIIAIVLNIHSYGWRKFRAKFSLSKSRA